MKSILSKLWFGITLLVIMIIILIWVFQVSLLSRFYIKERIRILQNEGTSIATLISKSNDLKILSQQVINEMDSFSSAYKTNVTIIDRKRNILYSSTNGKYIRMPLLNTLLNQDEIKKRIDRGQRFALYNKNQQLTNKFVTVGIPIKKRDTLIGFVILNSPTMIIQETIKTLRNQLKIITIISISVGTLLALIFAKVFTKPIIKINNAAKQIAKGNFSTKVHINSKDEIGVLGDTINDMSIQLGQIEKFRKEFIANTSHELKTPISLIIAYAELIKDSNDEDNETKNQYLDVITDESARLNKMVEDILYLSKMEAGYYKPKFEQFNIVEIIEPIINKLSCIAEERGVKLELDINKEYIDISADKDKIQHVLLNLVNNAIIHSSTNGKVIIKMQKLNSNVRVEIKDNGVGIPKEDLPYIWDRFYKVDKSRKRKDNGTGLGMAIVKNILETHNFEYGIDSKVGQGTTVWFEMRR